MTPRRRDIIAGSAATSALLLTGGRAAASPAAAARPNIVWIVCHDIHAPLLGCYGNRLAHTPTIDRLAQDGILYRKAFSTAPVCAPSRFALVTGAHAETCAPSQNMRANGVLPAVMRPLPVLMRAAGYYCTNNVFTDYNMAGDQEAMWDDCNIHAHWRNRPAGKPFFAVYNYLITHEMHMIGGRPVTDPAAVDVPPFLPDTPEVRQCLALNIDAVNRQDESVAHLLGELAADGLAEDTIVFFLADHGGVHPRSKRYCFDDGLHVPLIARLPARLAHVARTPLGQPNDDVVSLIDMAPTVLALAGVTKPDTMNGRAFLGAGATPRTIAFSMRDRMDERYDLTHSARDGRFRYQRNYMPHLIYGQHVSYEWQLPSYQSWERAHLAGTLDAVQQRFWQPKPSEELYDTLRDPHSTVNLASKPQHHARLVALRAALDEHILAVHDNSFIPEGAAEQGYVESRVPGAYPLPLILEIANRGLERSAARRPLFLQHMADANGIVRFWAAHGLMLSGSATPTTQRALRDRLAVEPLAYVRCALAEGLIVAGEPVAGRDTLLPIASDVAQPRLAARALNILTTVSPDDLRPIRPALATIAAADDQYLQTLSRYLLLQIDGTYTPASRISVATRGDSIQHSQIGDPQI